MLKDLKFPKKNRLIKASEFSNVFQNPVKSSDACMVVLAKINPLAEPRLGLAIARKKVRRAVDRNRIKRIIRESFRHQKALKSLDIVVIANHGLAKKSNHQIMLSLQKHWQIIQKKCEKLSASS